MLHRSVIIKLTQIMKGLDLEKKLLAPSSPSLTPDCHHAS